MPEEKPVIGCNALHDEYPLSDYDFHPHIPTGDDDVDSDYDDDDDVCQSNIYRECVSSLPRRRHQTACGYTLARRQEHHQHHHRPAKPRERLTSRLRRSARKWEVMIFRDTQTNTHFIIIYISSSLSSPQPGLLAQSHVDQGDI